MSYWAIRLTSETRDKILGLLQSAGIQIPAHWDIKCDHITLAHSANVELDEWIRWDSVLSNFKGATTSFKITSYGASDGVIAVGVDANSLNEHPHITIAVAPGHKPVESNDIKYWKEVLCLEKFDGFLVKQESDRQPGRPNHT